MTKPDSSGDVWDDFFMSTRGTELQEEKEDEEEIEEGVDDVDYDSMEDADE